LREWIVNRRMDKSEVVGRRGRGKQRMKWRDWVKK